MRDNTVMSMPDEKNKKQIAKNEIVELDEELEKLDKETMKKTAEARFEVKEITSQAKKDMRRFREAL